MAQYFENKNWEDLSKPKRWSPKGATWFKVEVDLYDLMYSETEKILTEMVAAKSTDTSKYEYLDHTKSSETLKPYPLTSSQRSRKDCTRKLRLRP